jgi:hypothetical protein
MLGLHYKLLAQDVGSQPYGTLNVRNDHLLQENVFLSDRISQSQPNLTFQGEVLIRNVIQQIQVCINNFISEQRDRNVLSCMCTLNNTHR